MKVENWWNEELKKYDDKLEINWNPKIKRFTVIRHNKKSTDLLLIIQDSDGGFLSPHPNLIIWGDKKSGFQGLNEVDFYNSGYKYVSEFSNELNQKTDRVKAYKKKKFMEYIGDKADDLYGSSAMTFKVSMAGAGYKSKE